MCDEFGIITKICGFLIRWPGTCFAADYRAFLAEMNAQVTYLT